MSFFANVGTFILLSPSRHQRVTTTMVVGLIDEIVTRTYDATQEWQCHTSRPR
jgi:hypothetical protein